MIDERCHIAMRGCCECVRLLNQPFGIFAAGRMAFLASSHNAAMPIAPNPNGNFYWQGLT